MNTPFKGFETKEITLLAGEDLEAGQVITLAAPCVATPAEEGNKFCGVCTVVRGDYASAVMHGCAKVSYSGTAPQLGYVRLAADGNGGVTVDSTNGREYLVVSVDETSGTAVIFVN